MFQHRPNISTYYSIKLQATYVHATHGDNPTIYHLIPNEYSPLKACGRLDKDSSGLLLLTMEILLIP